MDNAKKPVLQAQDQPRKFLSYYIAQNDWEPTVPRGPVAAMYNSPGPAIVQLPPTIGEVKHDQTKHKAPAYKIGIKLGKKDTDTGPGPGAYDIRGYTNQGIDHCRAPLIGIKLEPLKKFRTPGPADYSPEICDPSVYNRAPVYTMRIKLQESKRFKTPAPNTYTLPPVLGLSNTPYANRAPGYTMRIKPDNEWRLQGGPGPAAYMLPSTNAYRDAPPAYTVPKAKKATHIVETPGPLDHYAERVTYNKYSTPKCTFGIKHSQYKAFPGFAAE